MIRFAAGIGAGTLVALIAFAYLDGLAGHAVAVVLVIPIFLLAAGMFVWALH